MHKSEGKVNSKTCFYAIPNLHSQTDPSPLLHLRFVRVIAAASVHLTGFFTGLQTKCWRGDPLCVIFKSQEAGSTNAPQTSGNFLLNNTFSCFEQRWIQTKRSILGGNWWRLFSHPITHMHMASLHFYIQQSDLQTLTTRSPLVLQIYTARSNWSLIKEVLNPGWSEDPPRPGS